MSPEIEKFLLSIPARGPASMKIIVSNLLPREKTIQYCDIETRMEWGIPTGEFIHAFYLEETNTLAVSQEAYDHLKGISEAVDDFSRRIMKNQFHTQIWPI